MKLNWHQNSDSTFLNVSVAVAKMGGAFLLTRMALNRLPGLAPAVGALGCAFAVHDICTTPEDPVRNSRQHRWSILGPLVAMESAALMMMLSAGGMTRLFGGAIVAPILLGQSLLGIATCWNRDLLTGESPSLFDNIGSTVAKFAAGWLTGVVLFACLPHPSLTIGVSSLVLAAPNMGALLKDPDRDPRQLPLYRFALWSFVGAMQLAMLLHLKNSIGTIWDSRFGFAKTLTLLPLAAVTGLDLVMKGAQGYHSGLDWLEKSANSPMTSSEPGT